MDVLTYFWHGDLKMSVTCCTCYNVSQMLQSFDSLSEQKTISPASVCN